MVSKRTGMWELKIIHKKFLIHNLPIIATWPILSVCLYRLPRWTYSNHHILHYTSSHSHCTTKTFEESTGTVRNYNTVFLHTIKHKK